MSTKMYSLLMIASLALLPLAYADHLGIPKGAPRNVCDQDADDRSHEYGPSTGFVIFLGQDGNLNDCDGDFDPADNETETADYDGHIEFAFGGAWLTAAINPGCNPDDWADHPAFPRVVVRDYVLEQVPADVSFSVYADILNNIPPVDPNEPNCGDFESDFGVDCVNVCDIGFPPGLDGTYQVYVNGVTGEINTVVGAPVPPCADLLDPFVLGPTGSTTQVRSPGCNNLNVENHGPGSVEVKFSASGRTFIVPAGGSATFPWSGDVSVTIRALGTPATGTSQQV